MRAHLDALRQSLPSLMEGFVQTRDPAFPWLTSGTVYQYSRIETLSGMLGGTVFDTPTKRRPLESIWATSSVHLNDSQEFLIGKELLKTALAGLPAGPIRTQMRLALRDADALEVYCACFSAVEDDLSQWRGYGANGSGVCLGFDLERLLGDLDGVGYWVLYGKPGKNAHQVGVAGDLVAYIHKAIGSALTAVAPLLAPPPPGGTVVIPGAVLREIRQQLTEIWPTLCLAFKHLDFEAEKEFRIVYSEAVGRPISPSFRPHPLVPFVKLEMRSGAQIPLKHIRLRPAISSRDNLRSAKLALVKLPVNSVVVDPSDIPYVPK